jgi:hypothetical protein
MSLEEFKRKGGAWLGAARAWIQWNCKNGDSVIWGSSNSLNRKNHEFTVQDVEEIAAEAAFAAMEEYKAEEKKKEVFMNERAIEASKTDSVLRETRQRNLLANQR